MRFYIIVVLISMYVPFIKPMTTRPTPSPIDQLRNQLTSQVTDFNLRFQNLENRMNQGTTYNGNRITQLENTISQQNLTIANLTTRIQTLEDTIKNHDYAIRSITPSPQPAGVGLPSGE